MKRKDPKPGRGPLRRGLCLALAGALLAASLLAGAAAGRYAGLLTALLGDAGVQVTQAERAAADADAQALALQTETESAVLLQNRDATLPLDDTVRQVNVFGWAATQWLGGGSGSGGVTGVETDLLAALEACGIAYNTALIEMYRDIQPAREWTDALHSAPEQFCRLYEPDIRDESCYSRALLEQALAWSDTAIVVLGRPLGESVDAPMAQYKRVQKGGAVVTDASRTYLDLSTEEEALLAYVGANYANVIVLLNTAAPLALGAIETTPGVDACLLCGFTGEAGAAALPALLWGESTPSGRTADTWAYDFATAAAFANAGAGGVGAYTNADGLYPADGTDCVNLAEAQPYTQVSYVDYAEGIYEGYRWYETADAEGFWDGVRSEYGSGYAGVVQYPFGYGLSYTTFSWQVLQAPAGPLTGDAALTFQVKVTNTGTMPGREVVQLYAAPPYTPGGIEKPAVELAAFGKTELLQPGESQVLTLSAEMSGLAAYDFCDANGNGFAGYELEAGAYTFSLRRDAHTPDSAENAVITLYLAETVCCPADPATGLPVENRFTGAAAADGVGLDGSDSGQDIAYLTRADFAGTFPRGAAGSRPMPDSVAAQNLYAAPDGAGAGTDGETSAAGTDQGLRVTENGALTALGRTLGSNWDAPEWEPLLAQLSLREMEDLVTHAYLRTGALPGAGKPLSREADGPAQIGSFAGGDPGTGFPCPATLAQSWDTGLARAVGRAIGRQAAQRGYSGWYAPGLNLHRTPFGGRSYEYYSEDPLLSGLLGGSTAAGSLDAGVYCYLKHFVCNDQEAGIYRDGVYTWMTEQTLRELYLEPFRIAVEQFGVTGIMTSYNRLGAVWAGGSTALLTGVLRGEWAFHGAVLTDYSDHPAYMNGAQALQAGGDLWMDGIPGGTLDGTPDPAVLRRAAKDVLYMYLNARVRNEAAAAEDAALLRPAAKAGLPPWCVLLLAVQVAAAVLFALALRAVLRAGKRKERPE